MENKSEWEKSLKVIAEGSLWYMCSGDGKCKGRNQWKKEVAQDYVLSENAREVFEEMSMRREVVCLVIEGLAKPHCLMASQVQFKSLKMLKEILVVEYIHPPCGSAIGRGWCIAWVLCLLWCGERKATMKTGRCSFMVKEKRVVPVVLIFMHTICDWREVLSGEKGKKRKFQ